MAPAPRKKTRSRKGPSRARKPVRGRRRSRWRIAARLAALPLAALLLGLIFLDRKIVREFEARRWAVPAQVYARPLELYPGRRIDAVTLERHLARLGYGSLASPDRPGSYRRDGRHAVTLTTRPFAFWDGEQPARTARVLFEGSAVRAIESGPKPELALLRMEPAAIGSILPGSGEDRVLIAADDIPPLLTAALLAVEDRRFHRHFGIDLVAIGRALVANVRAGEVTQGGSTLTQQLVKSYFLTNERTFTRKLREALMSVLLDAHYAKDELLTAYLNEVYLGQDGHRAIHGFGLASQYWFGRPPQELDIRQTALLVGMIRGPSLYDPRRHPQRARDRRDRVLTLLAGEGVISADQAVQARAQPLGIVEGPAGGGRYPAFMDLVRRQLRTHYRDEDLTARGLRIFSTLDLEAQTAAEARLSGGLAALDSDGVLEGAAVVTGIPGGEVLALVGGRDPGYPGFNRGLDARRPVGSLLKPFVVLRALQEGTHTLVSQVDDEPLSVALPDASNWTPGNYDGLYRGPVPVFRALAESINIPVVRMALDVGLKDLADTLGTAGLGHSPQPYPSLALGSLALSPLEVTQLYVTLADAGFRTPLRAVLAVVDAEGEPLDRFGLDVAAALEPAAVYQVNQSLVLAVRRGTGRAVTPLLPEGMAVAGKTGTTDQLRDSWFAGFSDDRVVVVWVGRDDNQPAGLTGAAGALPIWARIMADTAERPYAPVRPAGINEVWVDYQTGLVADPDCARDGEWLAVPQGVALAAAPDCAPAAADDERRGVTRRALDWLKRVFD